MIKIEQWKQYYEEMLNEDCDKYKQDEQQYVYRKEGRKRNYYKQHYEERD